MIKELLGYFQKDYYQDLDRKVEKALDDYQRGLTLQGDEGSSLKESARISIEEQLVSSGQMEEAFINLDEFFPEGQRDEDKITSFRRDMTLHHSGQQMLWSFGGTTGVMTVLTEKHLSRMGRSLDALKPAGMKRREKKSTSSSMDSDTQRLYLYGNGKASTEYRQEDARLDFNRMKDKSGFDWKSRDFDRNYKVKKQGWFGALNSAGDWVRVNRSDEQLAEGIPARAPGSSDSLKLIYTMDGALLFDATLILGGEEKEEYYYSIQGDLYGGVKTDKAATLTRLKEEIGDRPLRGVVLPPGTPDQVKKEYRKVLGKEISLFESESSEVKSILEDDRKLRDELSEASLTLGAVNRLKQAGLKEDAIKKILQSEDQVIEIPLNPFAPEDRAVLAPGLSEDAAQWLDNKTTESSKDELSLIAPVVAGVLPLLPLALSSGLDEKAVLDEVSRVVLGGEPSELSRKTLISTVKLGDITGGASSYGADSAGEVPDFFQESVLVKTAEAKGLTGGETASFKQAMERVNIPPVNRKSFNQKMNHALSQYRSIQMSTGMTLFDLTSAVDSLTMGRPDAPRFAGKDIHFETTLKDAAVSSSQNRVPTKALKREELFQPVLASSDVVYRPGSIKVSPEDLSLARRLLEERSIPSYLTEETLSVLEETVIPPEGEISLAEVLETHLGEGESAVAVTRNILNGVEEENDQAMVLLTDRQLSLLRNLYLEHGADAVQAEEAVALWKKQSFTPQGYKTLRKEVQTRLASSDPVNQIQRAVATYTAASSASSLWSDSDKQVIAQKLKTLGASDASAEVLTRQFGAVNVPGGAGSTVKAVTEAFLDSQDWTHPVLPADQLIPAITEALAGNWDRVPATSRGALQRAVNRTAFRPASGGSGTMGKVMGQKRSSFPSIVRPAGITSSSLVRTPISVSTGKRQIPLPVSFSKGSGSEYRNLGYRLKPDSFSVEALSPQTQGTQITGWEGKSQAPVPGKKKNISQAGTQTQAGTQIKRRVPQKIRNRQINCI